MTATVRSGGDSMASRPYDYAEIARLSMSVPSSNRQASPKHDKLRELRVSNLSIRPATMDEWQKMFRDLYATRNGDDQFLEGDLEPSLFRPDDDLKDKLRKHVLVNVLRLVGEVGE